LAVLHDLIVPTAFYVALVLHLGAVTKRHFGVRQLQKARHMLQ